MNVDDAAVTSAVGRLAEYEFTAMGVHEALDLIVDAMPALFAVDGAGILLLDDDRDLRHAASSDGKAQILEVMQETTARGPCVSALLDDEVIQIDDLTTDERWPELADVLVDKGIRGILGVPVHIAGAPIGSLNVYHRDAHGWDESDIRAILAFDRIIEHLLTQAVQTSRNEAIVDQLERALASRITIDRAVGMVMGLHELSAADAFERLRRSARSARRTVEEISAEVLAERRLAQPNGA